MGTRKNHKQHPPLVNPAMRHTKPLTPLSCQHRWRIEEAQGPTSEGRCAHCNSSRKFPELHCGG